MMAPARFPAPTLPWPIARAGVELIAQRESCRLTAYKCPAGVWTCGWGETSGVTARTVWTQAYADQRFCDSLTEFAHKVADLCTRLPTEHELAAMVSLAYNIGMGDKARGIPGFSTSSVLAAHNRGDTQAAARAFALWNKARINGQLTVLAGLTARRAAEAALYLTPVEEVHPEPMPQAVAPESSMAASPIAATGTATAGLGVVAAAGQLKEQLGPLGDVLTWAKGLITDTLGLPPSAVLPVLLVAAGAAVVWYRMLQRRQGWA